MYLASPISVAQRRKDAKIKTMKTNSSLYLALAFGVMFLGCVSTPSPKATAAARTKPYIVALKAYHRDTGDYPQQLDELRPRYLGVKVPWHGNAKDADRYWVVFYEKVDRNNYRLNIYSAPCSLAVFENGRLVSVMGPYYGTNAKP